MATLKNRVEQLHKEVQFRTWLESARLLESFSDDQLEELAVSGRFPDPVPQPPPAGLSSLDKLDRKSLLKEWRESEHAAARLMRESAGRDEDQFRFQLQHGHWPERACCEGICFEAWSYGGKE
jgi:hypothetical protein